MTRHEKVNSSTYRYCFDSLDEHLFSTFVYSNCHYLVPNNIPWNLLLQNLRHRNNEKLHRILNKNHRWNSNQFHTHSNSLLLS